MKGSMNPCFRVLLIIACVFVAVPAFAYGDPTGGTLFQILTPVLAMIWGVWLIVANSVRERVSNLLHKWRGKKREG